MTHEDNTEFLDNNHISNEISIMDSYLNATLETKKRLFRRFLETRVNLATDTVGNYVDCNMSDPTILNALRSSTKKREFV